MATIKFNGLDEYINKLSALEQSVDVVVHDTIHDGAGVVADEVRSRILGLRTCMHNGKLFFGTPAHLARGPSLEQKLGLLDSFGITPISDDGTGFINAHIGFGGYNSVRTPAWPNGQPNLMVARSVNSGTSFMEAQPFFKEAVAKSRPKARKAMKKRADMSFDELWKAGMRRAHAKVMAGKKPWED